MKGSVSWCDRSRGAYSEGVTLAEKPEGSRTEPAAFQVLRYVLVKCFLIFFHSWPFQRSLGVELRP